MLTGLAYTRALRTHLLTSAALCSMLLLNLDDESLRQRLSFLHEDLMNEGCSSESVIDDSSIQQLLQTVTNQMDEERKRSRTGSLLISYMEQVSLLKFFLYAERTGQWKLHLQCITRMIP